MGFLDVLLGRSRPAPPDLDVLFRIPGAALTAAPNPAAAITRGVIPARPRAAMPSPPSTAPTPMAGVRWPKVWASPCSPVCARTGRTTWNS